MIDYQLTGYANIIGKTVIALAQLAGAIVAGVLVARKAGRGAVLALVAFALLFLNTVCGTLTLRFVLPQVASRLGSPVALITGLNCFESLVMVIALALLIAGLWTALGQREV